MPGVKNQKFCNINLPSEIVKLVTVAPGHSGWKRLRAFKEEKNLFVVIGFVIVTSLWTL